MRIYYWLISAFLLLPVVIMAQSDTGALNDTANGSDGMNGMNGAGAGYGAGWWFWTLLLLAILFTIVWWAVRAGNTKSGRKRS